MNTDTNGNGTTMDAAVKPPPATLDQDEREFLSTLPGGQWMLVRLEKPKSLSSILHVTSVRSPFATVIQVGPDLKSDIQPGDRITYAECLNLPKELNDVAWSKDLKWVHENKFLGRIPRNAEEKMLRKSLTPMVDDPDRRISPFTKGLMNGDLNVEDMARASAAAEARQKAGG